MSQVAEKGSISIHTENIFPIIKKFLYSDHEIFLRELVSNAVDATQKLKKLTSIGEFKDELGDLTIDVKFDKKKKTITVSDRGIGMTGEEIKKYINQIAFSGAAEFVERFKDKGDAKDIIGKFGLGFYSSFMVADSVESFPDPIPQEKAMPSVGSAMAPQHLNCRPLQKTRAGRMSSFTSTRIPKNSWTSFASKAFLRNTASFCPSKSVLARRTRALRTALTRTINRNSKRSRLIGS